VDNMSGFTAYMVLQLWSGGAVVDSEMSNVM
jgi:hypothetical protein